MSIFKPPSRKGNNEFYAGLMSNRISVLFWGKERFDAMKALESYSIKKYFQQPVSRLIKPSDIVLDLGCGSGIFIPIISPLCNRLMGVEVAPVLAEQSREVVRKFNLQNTSIIQGSAEEIPFGENSFDAVLSVDLLHHLEHLDRSLREIKRVLKSSGTLIVYEPNILNFLLLIMCLLDRNEHGVLKLGRRKAYKKLLEKYFIVENMVLNGLLIGPDGKFNVAITEFMNRPIIRYFVGWQNPKIFMTLRNP